MTIRGTVRQTWQDKYAAWVLIDQAGGKPLAVRVWQRALREEALALKPGAAVEFVGELASREGKDGGRWFTDYEAQAILPPDAKAGGKQRPTPQELGDEPF